MIQEANKISYLILSYWKFSAEADDNTEEEKVFPLSVDNK